MERKRKEISSKEKKKKKLMKSQLMLMNVRNKNTLAYLPSKMGLHNIKIYTCNQRRLSLSEQKKKRKKNPFKKTPCYVGNKFQLAEMVSFHDR